MFVNGSCSSPDPVQNPKKINYEKVIDRKVLKLNVAAKDGEGKIIN